MQYRHLFFDLDHTLWDFDTNSKEALKDIYQHHQLEQRGIDQFNHFFERYSFHNHLLWERYAKGQIKQDELRWKRMYLAMLDFKLADESLARNMGMDFLDILPNKNKLFPYTHEILTYLKEKGYILHLITNGFEQVQQHKLNKSNIGQYFNELITSEVSNSLKPNKEIFDYALNKTGANVQNSMMIGDNLEADIQGGINAGMDTVFVNHILATPHIQPTYTIVHLKELETIL
jgi:putative hydrolase of the HAD superfamily